MRTIHLNIRGLSAEALVSSAVIDRTVGLIVVLVMGSASLALSADIVLDYRSKSALLGFILLVIGAVGWQCGEVLRHSPPLTRGDLVDYLESANRSVGRTSVTYVVTRLYPAVL